MRRRGDNHASVLANPVLVGAVTVLVTLVAVFLAYNANNGLPFVPTTTLKARLINGANVVPGNEVRSGGYRVGVVRDMAPVRLADGTVGAEVTLKLDKTLGDIPRDSTVVVRNRSALGLKYVDLQEGKSREAFRDGDTLSADQGEVPVELDRVLEMFDEKTRAGARKNLQGFGDSFTGRGGSVGRAIEELPRTFGHLEPVMRTLADEQTGLKDFFKELGDAARIVAPVAETHARLYTSMADTFAAIGRDETALKDLISKSPPTMDSAIASFQVQRPFLGDLRAFSDDFAGATRELRAALPTVNRAISRGIGVQRRAVPMNEELAGVLGELRKLTEAPGTTAALRGLTATVTTLNPQLRFYGPYQTVCNSWNYFWTYVGEHFAEPDSTGNAQRALVNSVGRQDDSLSAQGANAPANGEKVEEGEPQYLKGPTLGRAIAPDGSADCETGQRGFIERSARHLPPQYKIHVDHRNPGLQGPTFAGRPRVPAGQTFTDLPETGPYSKIPASELGEP
jgi:virulence factor Mce-like protein